MKTEPKPADFSLGQTAREQHPSPFSDWHISQYIFPLFPFHCLEIDIFMSIKSMSPHIVSCHVMHGWPQFLFSSGIHCSACFALLESSMRCTWPTQRSSFLYCGLQHVLSCCFPCSFIIKYTFNILLRQDAVISFNCRSVITCCHSTATCAPVFSLTSHCWNSRFISLHQLTGKIPENSGTKITKRRRRQ